MATKLFVLLIFAVFASEREENVAENGPKNQDNSIVVKIEEDEYAKVNKSSNYIGVSYFKNISKWQVQRRSKNEKKLFSNGYYGDEETAAHASDTLARKFMENGERDHKLNFPDDLTEVYPAEKKAISKYIGISYYTGRSTWGVRRWSTYQNKLFYNGCYDDEETAAHASDTLARKLMENGDQKLKLNFPDDHIEVYPGEKSSKFIGVTYNKKESKWYAQRWNRKEKKVISNGCYDDEETAAHASDTLARKLMENCEQKLKLNFPDNYTEVYPEGNQKKRKRAKEFAHTQTNKFI